MGMDRISAYAEQVYRIVAAIPAGRVATYGQIAFLTGHPRRSRMVGHAMSHAPAGRCLPCHRVVNHAGRTAPGWPEQRTLLEREGVRFRRNGCADLDRHLWEAMPGMGDFSGVPGE